VVGGGDTACEESLFLTKFANKVTMLVRRDEMKASQIMQDRVKNHEKIEIKWNTVVTEVLGDEKKVTGVRVKDHEQEYTIDVDGVFVAIGHHPNTDIFNGVLELDAMGYVKADNRMRTNMLGVFACGDVIDHIYMQAVTAAGSGCKAAIEAEHYLEN
jgi:thioredoxin reductase (NADPH)